mgnify:CR=1 FL=1
MVTKRVLYIHLSGTGETGDPGSRRKFRFQDHQRYRPQPAAADPENYQVIHLCGKGNLDPTLHNTEGYVQYEYANAELADLFAVSELVISRAGANSICELLALHKPNILIPLSKNASRGDQILNANSFKKQGFSYVIEEEELTDQTLSEAIHTVWDKRADYIHAMESSDQMDAVTTITDLIEKLRKH